MGVAAKTIDSSAQLKAELAEPVKGISVVVVNAPNRDTNADLLKGIYSSIASM
jgi:2-succinyl-5-enolpyruvyl-6-hydroxy-3-cyclohexene-1-carboxylate synthase